MKRVLLLNPPHRTPLMRDTFHPTAKSALYVWHPLDLVIQTGYLRDCDVRVYDGVVAKPDENLASFLEEFRPEAVLSLVASPSLRADMALLKNIKDTYGATIFAEGDVTYGRQEAVLDDFPFLDGVLFDFVSSGFAVFAKEGRVHNAACRIDGRVQVDRTRDRLMWDIPRHDLFRLDSYYLPYWRPPFASVYTSHGCNSNCSFCPVPAIGAPRFRDHELILEELDELRRRGVNKVFFRDASFNQAPQRMIALCEAIARRVPGLRFTAWFRPAPLNADMADALRDAGCAYLHLGVETGSADFLRRMGKDFELSAVVGGVKLLQRRGIRVIGHFMIGVPGETDADYRASLRYVRRTNLDVISISVFEQGHGVRLQAAGQKALTDRILRRRLMRMMAAYYLRPSRWPGFLRFIESVGHFWSVSIQTIRYMFGLRLYPRIRDLE